MKPLFYCILSAFMLINTPAFAVKILSYPVFQAPECHQSYENASQPKTLDQVLSALNITCQEKKGVRVIYKPVTAGNSSEPIDIIFQCIAENPADFILFHCTYGSRNEI